MTTIDLGEVGSAGEAEPVSPGLDRQTILRAGLAAALLGLLAAGGSVRIATEDEIRDPERLQDSDTSMLSADTAYLNRATTDGYSLTAYDLATGRVRWETAFDGALGYAQLAGSDGLILLPAQHRLLPPAAGSDDSSYIEFVTATVAVEAATGRTVWRIPGQAQMLYRDTALMNEYDERGTPAVLRLVRLGDHRTLWSLRTPELYTQTVATVGGRPDRLVTATRDGRVDVYRYADGTRLATGKVAWAEPRPRLNQFSDIVVTQDHLVVNRTLRGESDLHVYRLDTLAELWHMANPSGWAFGCGPSLCVDGGNSITAYDPATGRPRWRREGVTGGGPVLGDRIIVDDRGHPMLLDAATGRQVGQTGDGVPVWPNGPAGDLYLMRPTESPPGRTSITRWDLAAGRTSLLGAVDPLPGERCQVTGRYLACIADKAYEVVGLS